MLQQRCPCDKTAGDKGYRHKMADDELYPRWSVPATKCTHDEMVMTKWWRRMGSNKTSCSTFPCGLLCPLLSYPRTIPCNGWLIYANVKMTRAHLLDDGYSREQKNFNECTAQYCSLPHYNLVVVLLLYCWVLFRHCAANLQIRYKSGGRLGTIW